MPFVKSKNDDTNALGTLYRACVQNSRKWKSERAPRKKVGLHSGIGLSKMKYAVRSTETPSVSPRLKDRVAMPLCDRFCPGRRCAYGTTGNGGGFWSSASDSRRTCSSRRGVHTPAEPGRPNGHEIEGFPGKLAVGSLFSGWAGVSSAMLLAA